jgi:hypothetical protein
VRFFEDGEIKKTHIRNQLVIFQPWTDGTVICSMQQSEQHQAANW